MTPDAQGGSPPPGIEPDAVTAWLLAHVPGLDPPLRFEVLSGGRSNLSATVVDAAGRALVLRRPPLSGVLPSAHDVSREHRILSALADTPVPVPRVFGLCPDAGVTGAPFFVMEFVDGVVPRDAASVASTLTVAQRRVAGERLVDSLVVLHGLDPAAVGLEDFGRGEGYVERQLARWHDQLRRLDSREIPLMDEVHARLVERVPAQQRTCIVHGDYRLGNTVVGPSGSIEAVLDWELSTLGDPLCDLGWMLVYWEPPPGADAARGLTMPTTAAGFPSRQAALTRYVTASGLVGDHLGFYLAFSYWKLAAILEGVRVRFTKGAYGQPDDSHRGFEDIVLELAEAARAAIGER